MRSLVPLPRCLTCGRVCRRRWVRPGKPVKYCSVACVPRSARQQGGRKSGEPRALASRLKLFQQELRRLRALPKLTGEDLMASFQTIRDESYQAGYWACEAKWRYREKRGAAA